MSARIVLVAIVAIAAGGIGGIGAWIAARLIDPPAQVAMVDLASLVTERVQRPELAALSEAERARDAARFALRMERAIARLAEDYGVALLAAPAVVAGAPDLTHALRTRLESRNEPTTTPR